MESAEFTHYRTECMRFLFWRRNGAAAPAQAESAAPAAASAPGRPDPIPGPLAIATG
ncbi:MAG: hypothetical protein H0W72_15335 [Planctomycetes bacterium]|nr:hypothetical protein [Planctomycetota bacterium]